MRLMRDHCWGIESSLTTSQLSKTADYTRLDGVQNEYSHQGPCNNSRTSIVEELEIKVPPESRVEFDTHEEIVHCRTFVAVSFIRV